MKKKQTKILPSILFSRKHASLCEINKKVLEALQMYHNLMKETPAPYAYKSMPYTASMPQGQPMVNVQVSYVSYILCQVFFSNCESGNGTKILGVSCFFGRCVCKKFAQSIWYSLSVGRMLRSNVRDCLGQ